MIPNFKHRPNENLHNLLCSKGAETAAFQDRSAIEHYTGTYSVLKEWGNNDDICNAGLFHGIYMDAYFSGHDPTLENRENIRAHIGEEAEKLAYIHCFINRRQLIIDLEKEDNPKVFDKNENKELSLTLDQKKALAEMIWANAFEQFYVYGVYPEERNLHLSLFNGSKNWVSQNAQTAFATLFQEQLENPALEK